MSNRICSTAGCDKKAIARGLCAKHYQQAAKDGLPPLPKPARNSELRCSAARCTNQVTSRGLCTGHYGRWRKTGDVQADVPLQKKRLGRTELCSVDDCTETYAAKGLCKKHYTTARTEVLKQEPCAVSGCPRPRGATGDLCPAHYQRHLQYGDPLAGPAFRKQRGGKGVSNHGALPNTDAYYANHRQVRAERGPAWQQVCAHCGGNAQDWATIHGQSGEQPEDYMPLCKSCHHAYDGLAANLPVMLGEAHPGAKLTEDQVREIRARAAAGELKAHLARTFGVSQGTIHNVILRRNWKHVA